MLHHQENFPEHAFFCYIFSAVQINLPSTSSSIFFVFGIFQMFASLDEYSRLGGKHPDYQQKSSPLLIFSSLLSYWTLILKHSMQFTSIHLFFLQELITVPSANLSALYQQSINRWPCVSLEAIISRYTKICCVFTIPFLPTGLI